MQWYKYKHRHWSKVYSQSVVVVKAWRQPVYSQVKENCFLLYPNTSDTNYLESAQIPQVKGSVSQDCPPLQAPITSPGLPYFWSTGYTLGVPKTPSSGLIICCNSWQNYKEYNSVRAKRKRCTRQVWGKGRGAPMPFLSGYITLPAPWCVH